MNELEQLKAKVDQIDRRLRELEMRGAGSVHEAIGSLDDAVNKKIAALEKRCDQLQAQIRSAVNP